MKKTLCAVILALCFLVFTGCGNQLSKAQIDQANKAFADTIVIGNSAKASEISCFFTCYYSDPREIDLWKFLQYCPAHVRLTVGDEQEFFDWLDASNGHFEGVTFTNPDQYVVPVWRYTRESVSALLSKYAGITVEDLTSWGDALYMEAYDSFYNCTSDYGPGRFECIGGEREGTIIRFWSEPDQEEMREVLTLEKVGEQYYIRSFLQEKAP